ncbi:hypothetical protein DFH27DRAFT_639942 [Peziza echinospora]|nr:hypothetical protein DFH27DRAFT_639942 [Peziza echinospora]
MLPGAHIGALRTCAAKPDLAGTQLRCQEHAGWRHPLTPREVKGPSLALLSHPALSGCPGAGAGAAAAVAAAAAAGDCAITQNAHLPPHHTQPLHAHPAPSSSPSSSCTCLDLPSAQPAKSTATIPTHRRQASAPTPNPPPRPTIASAVFQPLPHVRSHPSRNSPLGTGST